MIFFINQIIKKYFVKFLYLLVGICVLFLIFFLNKKYNLSTKILDFSKYSYHYVKDKVYYYWNSEGKKPTNILDNSDIHLDSVLENRNNRDSLEAPSMTKSMSPVIPTISSDNSNKETVAEDFSHNDRRRSSIGTIEESKVYFHSQRNRTFSDNSLFSSHEESCVEEVIFENDIV